MNTSLKLIVSCFLALIVPKAMAEGVASMTEVTTANAQTLVHHMLEVSCRSQNGKTFVDLRIRPEEKAPLTTCDVVILGQDGKKRLVEFAPKTDQAPNQEGMPKGSRVTFHVSDELIGSIEIRYHLRANDHKTHVFTIKPGELPGLSKLGSP